MMKLWQRIVFFPFYVWFGVWFWIKGLFGK